MTVNIGIDPDKATQMAVAIDGDERAIRLEVSADRCQTQRLLAWAAPLGEDRTWAIESAGGLGKLLSQQLLGDLRRLDRELVAIKIRIRDAVATSETTLPELQGVGPIVAALILAHVGDPARFATPARFTSYNGTAPIEASQRAPQTSPAQPARESQSDSCDASHRCDPSPSRHSRTRALRRRISDAVWRQLQIDLAAP